MLKLITGGKGSGGGGGKKGSSGGGGKKPKKKHWLADFLWRAMPADSERHIQQRLCKSTKQPITLGQTRHIINIIRENPWDYEWTIPHVKKGRDDGESEGKFFRVLVDRHDPEMFVAEDEHYEHAMAGAKSSITTVGSMCRNEGLALEFLAQMVPSRSAKRDLRTLSAALLAVGKVADQIAETIANGE